MTASTPTDQDGAAAEGDHRFFGQPKALGTLSGLEVWERFSFLGMQAILVLYFTASGLDEGLDLEPGTAASIAAAYGTLVYLVSVGGGWVADRLLGSYRAVLLGGVLIAVGHYTMAVPVEVSTWVGLVLISLGTGLLKPNVSNLVGKLYGTRDERRDAGFALYYMAINVGAFLGPLVTGFLGAEAGWHWGFSAAAVGMTLGLVQYVVGRRGIPGQGSGVDHPLPAQTVRRTLTMLAVGAVVVVLALTLLGLTGLLSVGGVVDGLTVLAMVAPIVYFVVLFRSPRVTPQERGRLRPFLVLWLGSVAFNYVLFQSYTVLILLGQENVDRSLFGWDFPASWFSSFLGLAEVAVAPLVAALWLKMGPRQPHVSLKVAIGVVLGGLAYLILAVATLGRSGDYQLTVWILLFVLLLVGLGDVLLETAGLSATSKLAPSAFSSQGMALWFLSLALANGIQAQTVQFYGQVPDAWYFGVNGAVPVIAGLAIIAARPWMTRTMTPVR